MSLVRRVTGFWAKQKLRHPIRRGLHESAPYLLRILTVLSIQSVQLIPYELPHLYSGF